MKLLDKIKSAVGGASNAGKKRLDSVVDARKRQGLQRELGELVYRQHTGEAGHDAAIASKLAALDELTEDETDPEN